MYLAVRLIVAWGVNVLALIVADWVFSGFTIGRWGSLLLAGAVFGLANVFLKPLLTFIAIPLIILLRQRCDSRVHGVGRPELLDRRLLDIRRSRDRDVARQRCAQPPAARDRGRPRRARVLAPGG